MSSAKKISNTTIDTALKWLVKLESPSLSDSDKEAFYEWLNTSYEHQAAYIHAEKIWLKGKALEKIPSASKEKKLNFALGPLVSSVSIASFFAIVLFAFLNLNMFRKEVNHVNYETGIGQQRELELSDGTVIKLNTSTIIDVALDGAAARVLSLKQGEVYLDVAHDKTRPFVVKTEDGLVVVLGTRFSVNKSAGHTTVTVEEGRVGLLPDEAKWKKQTIDVELKANQQMDLAHGKTILEVDPGKTLSWREGKLHFSGELLQDVVRQFNRYFQKQIVVGNESLKNRRVVAVIPLNDGFDSAISLLEESLNLRSKNLIHENKVMLLPKD